ncbi:MAG: alanine dehydrogenase [Verrucomicrobiota bacterium]|nr:alanine dehydrogenase [Verrucomicrobiota bacterium]
MIIGVPREIKANEHRVAMLPVGAQLLREDGHTVLVQKGAGLGAGFADRDYVAAGAQIAPTAAGIYRRAEMIVKVKEPLPAEIRKLRRSQILFCYFHFAASRELTAACLKSGVASVAYETLFDAQGRLPLLTPMSEVAGKMSIQAGARCLEKQMDGLGILLGGVAGVPPANVLVLGAGVVGAGAARVAAGMGANVLALDTNLDRIRYLDEVMPENVTVLYSDPHAIEYYATIADLVVGAVLIPGARAPALIKRGLLKKMKKGAVLVDVAIDQGGCAKTSRPTTHNNPTYEVEGVTHYCVANMPGAVPMTSSRALCNATLPYARQLARLGVEAFAAQSSGHAAAVNTWDGKLVNAAVAQTFPDLPRE